ncbi:unnamed protein product, partial [Cyprideis torosa]
MAREGDFLDDLYYRLNVVPIQAPPLRERIDDLPPLVRHFIEHTAASENLRPRSVEPAALARLMQHRWPGNIRELRNLVQRLMILGPGGDITAEEVDAAMGTGGPTGDAALVDSSLPLKEARGRFERDYFEALLKQHDGNVASVARHAGLERTHVYRKLKSLGLDGTHLLILGAGQVGASTAELLAGERNDVTVIDRDSHALQQLEERIDVRVVNGDCTHPDVLAAGGLEDADMLVAVTDSDAVNLVACRIAQVLFHTPTKVARLRAHTFYEKPELFERGGLAVDVRISPEQIVTRQILRVIEHPGALQVLDFAGGAVRMVAETAEEGAPLVGKPLTEFRRVVPDMDARIAAIFRNGESIRPRSHVRIEPGDEVFLVAETRKIRDYMRLLRPLKKGGHSRITIAGAGNIGLNLAQALSEQRYHVKVIEHSRERAQTVAEHIDG